MKKIMTFLSAGLLMITLCTGLAACNEPKAPEQEPNENEIQLVEVSDEIAAFFDENVNLIGSSIFFDRNDWENNEFVEACVMINSEEEFMQIDFRGQTTPLLPTINFDSYTLVIGQWVSGNGASHLESTKLIVRDDTATVNLIMSKDDLRFDVFHPLPIYFWGIYPKIDTETIGINVIN